MKNIPLVAAAFLLVFTGCGNQGAQIAQTAPGWRHVDYKDVGISLELPKGEPESARPFVIDDDHNTGIPGKLIGLKNNPEIRMDEPIFMMKIYVFRGKGNGFDIKKKENKFEFSYATFKYNDAFKEVHETSKTLTGDEAFPYKKQTRYTSMRGHNTPTGDVILAFGSLEVGGKSVTTEQSDRETIRHILNSVKGSEEK